MPPSQEPANPVLVAIRAIFVFVPACWTAVSSSHSIAYLPVIIARSRARSRVAIAVRACLSVRGHWLLKHRPVEFSLVAMSRRSAD